MFKKIVIVFLLYIIYTLLFADLTHLRKPNVEILKDQAADVKSGYNKASDYVDSTVIPYLKEFSTSLDDEKSLAGNLMDKIDIPSGQIQKESFSVEKDSIEEDTFFEDK